MAFSWLSDTFDLDIGGTFKKVAGMLGARA